MWEGPPGPRFEPGTGDLEAETLTTRPPHLLPKLLYIPFSEVGLCAKFTKMIELLKMLKQDGGSPLPLFK